MGKHKLHGVRNCCFCGKEVKIYHKERMTQANVYCSNKCCAEAAKKEPNSKCAVCGKPIRKKPYELRKAKHQPCCSVECMGKLRKTIYKGENNPNYGLVGDKSKLFAGVAIIHCGYIWEYVPDHPFAVPDAGMRVRQHRLVAEKFLLTEENSVEINGKLYLKPEFDVHHKDGNKLNNEPSNLEILTRSQHSKLHVNDHFKRVKSANA
jgi:hypothetical protein